MISRTRLFRHMQLQPLSISARIVPQMCKALHGQDSKLFACASTEWWAKGTRGVLDYSCPYRRFISGENSNILLCSFSLLENYSSKFRRQIQAHASWRAIECSSLVVMAVAKEKFGMIRKCLCLYKDLIWRRLILLQATCYRDSQDFANAWDMMTYTNVVMSLLNWILVIITSSYSNIVIEESDGESM